MTAFVRGVLAALLIALAGVAAAQDAGSEAPEARPDAFGRDTPRGAVNGLLAAFASNDPDAVHPYLDLGDIPEAQQRLRGRRLGAQLERVLDTEGSLLPGFRISAAPEGVAGDGLDPEFDRFAVLADPEADLLLRRTEIDGRPVWQVAGDTLALVSARAPSGPGFMEDVLPPILTDTRVAGASLAAWLSVLAVGTVSLLVGALVVAMLFGLARRALTTAVGPTAGDLLRPMRVPASLVASALIFQGAIHLVGVPIVARAAAQPIVEIAAWIAVSWLVLRAVHAAFDAALVRMTRRERLGAVSVISMIRRIVKVVVLVVASVLIAGSLGLDLTGWLAAFGLGGLAFALGAQKTIEHMVGGMSLIADQPLRVGDFCAVDGLKGTVEDIGLRSTRLRTLDRTLVTIPNGDLSGARIENFAGRDRFLWQVMLGLRYETTPDQMRMVLRRIDALLTEDARVIEGHRVRFISFGASSLDVEVWAYIAAPTYPDSLSIREELNLAMMQIIDECGTGFAFPSTTVYLARDAAPKAQIRAAA